MLMSPCGSTPCDADKLGVKNGDVVRIFNERGGVLGGVRVTERVREGVVYMDHGANSDIIVAGIGGLDEVATLISSAPLPPLRKMPVARLRVDIWPVSRRSMSSNSRSGYPDQFSRSNYRAAAGNCVTDYIVGEE